MNPLKYNIKGDRVIWAIIALLSIVSVLAVYSSTYNLAVREGHGILYYLLRHGFYLGMAILVMVILHNIPIGIYKKFSVIGLLFGLILLIFVYIFPDNLNITRGAYRWTEIPIIGISLQPSDAAKVFLIIYLAMTLEKGNFINFPNFVLRVLVPIAVYVGFIVRGNMSTAFLIGLTSLIIILISDIKLNYKINTLITIFMSAIMLFYVVKAHPEILPRSPTGIGRIERFFGVKDEAAAKTEFNKAKNFQPEQAMIAVASGGLFGKGPGNGMQQHILSEAYNDFIYAIIIEEYGLIFGGLPLILIYLALLYRCILIAKKCTYKFPIYTVLGLGILIVSQAFIHMAVSIGAIPVMGQTLPLVSLGGTSILFTGAAFGIILTVSRAAEEKVKYQLINEEESHG